MSTLKHTIIICVSKEAMQTLWPQSVKFGVLLLIVTDATPYMTGTHYVCSAGSARVLSDILSTLSKCIQVSG
jgi:hypothetical protein